MAMQTALSFVTLFAIYIKAEAHRSNDEVALLLDNSLYDLSKFDWSKPSCDVDNLKASDLAEASDVKKSEAGNMGGVYFLTLARPDCNVVIKPQLDLHDAYASALATRLGVPVAKTRLLTPKRDCDVDAWEALLTCFDSVGGRADFLTFVESGSGFAQMMAVAEGKDLYSITDTTLGWNTCDTCLTGEMREELKQKLGAETDDEIPDKFIGKMTTGRLRPDYRDLCKAMWNATVEHSPDKIGKFWGKDTPPRFCPNNWRQSDEFAADARAFYDANQHWSIVTLGAELARDIWKRKQRFCEDDLKPSTADTDAARLYVSQCFASAQTQRDMAKLSAFESFINENDGMNNFGTATSNYHNVFFSPRHATGIDMAVGGAISHTNIVAHVKPEDMEVVFKYEDVEEAASVTECGSDDEKNDLAKKYAFRMGKPYAGDRERHYQACSADKGMTASMADNLAEARHVVDAWHGAMKSILDDSDAAITDTTNKLRGLNDELLEAIEAWLRFHTDQLKEAFQTGVDSCE